MLLLVLVRWVLGCVVPKRYMEYLDDPLPEFMYRLPCKRRQMRDEPGVEMGNLMEFQVEPYARPSTGVRLYIVLLGWNTYACVMYCITSDQL